MFNRGERLLGTETRKARSVSATLRRFWAYFRHYWIYLVIAGVLVILSVSAQTAVPILIGQAVDCYLVPLADTSEAATCWYTTVDPAATPSELISGLGGLILIIVGLYVGNAAISGTQFFSMSYAGFQVLRDMRADVFRHVHRLTLSFFNKNEAGDVMSRFTNDMDTLQQIIGFGLVQVLQGFLLLVFITGAMITSNLPFAVASLLTLPLMILITRWLTTQARRAFRLARQEIGAVNADLQENISSVREVQAFSREEENIAEFQAVNAANRDANIRAQAFSSALGPSLEALSYVNIAIIAGVGGFALLGDGTLLGTTVSLGLIVTFINFAQQLNRPVQQIALLWANLQSAIAGGERIFGLLDEEADFEDDPDAMPMPHIQGHVQFQDVWAEYNPGEPVLRGVNLSASPGQTIAIVGPTGAGKTTMINLIPRFYDVSQGTVLVDGHDVRHVQRESLRQQIGIVLQDTFLFSDTIMNNIRYGKPDAGDEEVMAAAQLARADSFIERLPEGYETKLGERGSGLSQGQRQLIAIARVALLDPRILILDEATSSVDTRTERQIQAALDRLLSDRTSFVIAHRLSTIRNADQVLVVRAGEIIERGTHDELLARDGFYHDLYMSQFRREAPDAEASTPAVAD